MKNNEATIFIFIAAIITGFLIASSMSFNTESKFVFLSFNQYQEAYNEKTKLTKDIITLNEEYRQLNEKNKKYTESKEAESEHIKSFQTELNTYSNLNGLTSLQGNGIEILLDDYEGLTLENYSPNNNVHDKDLINIINDLRAIGAEAISLNGHRIMYNSEVYCYGANILVNGISIPAPFTIDAIGDVDKIKTFMKSEDSTLGHILTYRKKINVKIEEKNNLIIPAYNSNIDINYMSLKK